MSFFGEIISLFSEIGLKDEYNKLLVEDRIIKINHSRTISIDNTASLTIFSQRNKFIVGILIAASLFSLIISAYIGLNPYTRVSSEPFIIAPLIMFFVIMALPPTHYLQIYTNDGQSSLFKGQKEFLKQVKSSLDERLNHNNSANFVANFAIGRIETVEHMGDKVFKPANTVR